MWIPTEPVAVPDRVRALARGAGLEPVWLNEIGGLTFRTDDERYIKFGPRNGETSFAAEAERLGVGGPLHTRAARSRAGRRRRRTSGS